MLVTTIWLYFYLQFPYLFPVAALPLYFLGYDPSLHLAFPISLWYMQADLSRGNPPYNHKLLWIELLRLVIIYVWGPAKTGLISYCSSVALGLILSSCGFSFEEYINLKIWWTIPLLFFQNSMSSIVVLILSQIIDLDLPIDLIFEIKD